MTTYNDYWLAHHGILGQKWGVRNGPPYPLGSDVSTGHRLKEGASGKTSTVKKDPDKVKRNKATQSVVKSGLGLKVKTREYTIDEDIKAVNPKYNSDAEVWEQPEYHQNCCYCTATYEMRRRGYDVQARPRDDNKKYHDLTDYYLNPNEQLFFFKGEQRTKTYGHRDVDINPLPKLLSPVKVIQMTNDVKNYIKDMPDGARGSIEINWYFGGGHLINFEKVDNNNIYVIDAQCNEKYNIGGANNVLTSKWFAKGNLIYSAAFAVTRLDDVDVFPDNIKGACK